MLPDPNYSPALLPKTVGYVSVALCIRAKLFSPEGSVVLRDRSVPRTAVPEASVQKYSDTMATENEVWL
jgi:hypothetical protein